MPGEKQLENLPISVRMLSPAERLKPLIDAYYIVETYGPMQDRYLAGPGNIRFRTSGNWMLTIDGVWHPTPQRSALFGPTERTGLFGPTDAGVMLGAGLTPIGWAALLDISAAEMAGRVCELSDVIGVESAEEIASAIEAAVDDVGIKTTLDEWLTRRAASRPAGDPRVGLIHQALFTVPESVEAFAAAAGVTLRTLHRLSLKAFGFPPAALLRQKRFQRTLERVRGVLDRPLTQLIDDGYCDQAHFNREFRKYMGLSPTEYFNSPREIMRRSAEVRAALNGPGLQGLHPSQSLE